MHIMRCCKQGTTSMGNTKPRTSFALRSALGCRKCAIAHLSL